MVVMTVNSGRWAVDGGLPKGTKMGKPKRKKGDRKEWRMTELVIRIPD